MNLINLTRYFNDIYEKDLFENIKINPGLDKDLLVNTILDYCGIWDCVADDPLLMQKKIEIFFYRRYDTYSRLIETLQSDYNPLHNYDRYEKKNENRKFKGTDTTDETIDSIINETDENKVSAFNNATYQPSSEDITTGKNQDKKNGTYGKNDNEDYITDNHLYGNIGVTTSQQMLESEINLREKYNIYEIIAKDFFKQLMVGCY